MAYILKMDPMVLPPFSVLYGDGYVSNAVPETIGYYIRYRLYLFLSDVALYDVFFFVFNCNIDISEVGKSNRFLETMGEVHENEKIVPANLDVFQNLKVLFSIYQLCTNADKHLNPLLFALYL